MQRLLQLLPSSTLRLSQRGSALSRPSFLTVLYPLRSPVSVTSTCISTRFASSQYMAQNTLQPVSLPTLTSEERWREKSKDALDPINRRPNNTYTGRSVVNTSGKNLAITFKKLDSILARNRIRQELRLTERHEKKGEKRRRLKSQRWKNRFANEVRQKVQLVNKIRMRGA